MNNYDIRNFSVNEDIRRFVNNEVVIRKFLKNMYCSDLEKLTNKVDLDDADKEKAFSLNCSIARITSEIEYLCIIYKKFI